MINFIIIVEDKPEEQAAALEAIKQAMGGAEEVMRRDVSPGNSLFALIALDGNARTQVSFAPNLNVARVLLKEVPSLGRTAGKVGVITDLMFPQEIGGKEEPNGLSVVAECIEAKLPVVVCSDTDHHELAWLSPVFPFLERAHPTGKIPVILDKKDWERAAALLAGIQT